MMFHSNDDGLYESCADWTKLTPLPAVVATVLVVVLLSGCDMSSQNSAPVSPASSSKVKVPQAVANDPCRLLSPQAVADLFSVPVGQISQTLVSTTCGYDWKAGPDRLDVNLTVQAVSMNAAEALANFDSSTRSMSANEVSDAFTKIDAELEKRGDKSAATDTLSGAMGATGGRAIMFEDVNGIGDKARFDADQGELHVLIGNLYVSIAAYHGPRMQMPEGFSMQQLPALAADWQRETTPQRKAAAEQVARAVLDKL